MQKSNLLMNSHQKKIVEQYMHTQKDWWQKSYITYPFRVLTSTILWLPRKLLMAIILPISSILPVHHVENNKLHYTDNGMIHYYNQYNSNDISNRELMIVFGGNSMDMHNYIEEHQKDFFSINNKKDYIIMQYHRGVSTTNVVKDQALMTVISALKAGYQPKNIHIFGHSIGGIIAMSIMPQLNTYLSKHYENPKIQSLTIHKSLTSLSDVISNNILLNKIISFIAKLFSVNLDIKDIFKNSSSIPAIKKNIIQSVYDIYSDGAIPYKATPAYFILQKEYWKNMSINTTTTFQHLDWHIKINNNEHHNDNFSIL